MGAPGATSPALGIFLLVLSAMMVLLSIGAVRHQIHLAEREPGVRRQL